MTRIDAITRLFDCVDNCITPHEKGLTLWNQNKNRVAQCVAHCTLCELSNKRKNPVTVEITGFNAGAPRGIRTHNPLIRSYFTAFLIAAFRKLSKSRQPLNFQGCRLSLFLIVPFRRTAFCVAYYHIRVACVWPGLCAADRFLIDLAGLFDCIIIRVQIESRRYAGIRVT